MRNKLKGLVAILVTTSALNAAGDLSPVTTPVAVIPQSTPIPPFYLGLGFLWSGMSRDCACAGNTVEEETYGGFIKAGYRVNEYADIELRGLYSDIEKDIASTTHYGVFVKPTYPLTEKLDIYGLVGYAKTKLDCLVTSLSYEEWGFSYGAGAEYRLEFGDNDNFSLFAEYQNLLRDETINNFNSNIVVFGLKYRF